MRVGDASARHVIGHHVENQVVRMRSSAHCALRSLANLSRLTDEQIRRLHVAMDEKAVMQVREPCDVSGREQTKRFNTRQQQQQQQQHRLPSSSILAQAFTCECDRVMVGSLD